MKKFSFILAILVMYVVKANAVWQFENVTTHMTTPYTSIANTVAWGDIDNDGDLDLFIGSTNNMRCGLYKNDQTLLSDVTQDYGLTNLPGVRTAKFVDYNGDGNLDLFCINSEGGVTLMRQNSNHRFQQVVIESEHDLNVPIQSAVFYDLNEDGALDLLLSNSQTENGVMIPLLQTNEEFSEQRGGEYEFPLENASCGAICVLDFDRDGDTDIFCGAKSGYSKTKLYSHDSRSGMYQNVRAEVGLPDNIGQSGAVWADFNNDQRLDLFCPGMSTDCHLFVSRVDNQQIKFDDISNQRGFFPDAARSEYACAIDANMDGWMDLYVPHSGWQGCSLLINHGGEWWENVSTNLRIQFPNQPNVACAWGDFDGDGDLDLAIAERETGIRIYRNNLTDGHEFVGITLCGTGNTTPLPGCDVLIKFEHGKQTGCTWSSSCTPGGDSPTLMLANPSSMKSKPEECVLTVSWPNGVTHDYPGTDFTLRKNNVLHEPVVPVDDQIAAANMSPEISAVELNNYPNPFNPNTSVNFTLSEAGRVELSVFNLLGQEVAVLANDNFSAGVHRVNFNAGDLPSGLYLARMNALGHTVTQRLLLTK